MASICNDPGGRRRILFIDKSGKRWAVRLGKLSARQAMAIKAKVEDLITAQLQSVAPADETSRWVAGLNATLRDKLAKTGLVKARESMNLGAFIAQYIARRQDVKQSTRTVYGRTENHLVAFFGADKPLDAITPANADSFQAYLIERLALNTARRTIGICRQFFKAATGSPWVRP